MRKILMPNCGPESISMHTFECLSSALFYDISTIHNPKITVKKSSMNTFLNLLRYPSIEFEPFKIIFLRLCKIEYYGQYFFIFQFFKC